MGSPSKNKLFLIAIILALALLGGLILVSLEKTPVPPPVTIETPKPRTAVIGRSVEGRDIEAVTFGEGKDRLIFVGGIHGGYEWNSVLLAYRFIDYLTLNPDLIPTGLSVTIVASANPDGVYKVTGKEGRFLAGDVLPSQPAGTGRFNANNVDLNRNFDCNWKPQSTWKSKTVSAGTTTFSEPESQVIRDFVKNENPRAVVFWHSQSGTVYASQCQTGILPETLDIMNSYAKAAGYKTNKTFDSYAITGDAEGWLASIGIPAVTVELTTHETIEWEKNLAGVKAILQYFGQQTKTSPI